MDPPQQQPWGDAAAGSAISSDPHAATSQDDANAPAVPGPAEPGPPAPVVDNVDMAVAEEGLVVEVVPCS